jgi:coproporphyrinogen III oxidase-like Fe-S oxidoreductase
MLGLRTAEGVSLARLREEFPPDLLARLQPISQFMQQAGLLEITRTHWRPTLRGMMLNNRLAGAFL